MSVSLSFLSFMLLTSSECIVQFTDLCGIPFANILMISESFSSVYSVQCW